MFDLLILESVY